MKLNINKVTSLYILIMLSIVLNFVIFPKLILVQVFTAAYITLIYKNFASDNKEMIYYSTLLFALINFSLKFPLTSRYDIYYFYITLFIYMIWIIYIYVNKIYKDFKFFKVKRNKYLIFLIIFFIYMIFSLVLALDKKFAIKYIFNFTIMISLLIMMVIENSTKVKLTKTLNFLKYVYIGILSLGILEMFGIRYGVRNHFQEWDPVAFNNIHYVKKIPVVFFYNPNNYAIFLVLGMVLIAMQIVFSKSKKEKVFYTVLYIISQISLIFTRSRTAWVTIFLALFFSLFYYLFINKEKNKEIIKSIGKITFGTLMLFLLVSFIPNMQPFYGKITGSKLLSKLNISGFDYKNPDDDKIFALGKKGSTNERYTLLYDVVHGVFIKKHYLGFGAGNIEKYVEYMNNTFGVFNVHSLWFEILGNFGIGILLYVIYIYLQMIFEPLKFYKYGGNLNKKYIIMFSTSTFAFVFLSFAPSTIMWYPAFWMTLGITISLIINKGFIKN